MLLLPILGGCNLFQCCTVIVSQILLPCFTNLHGFLNSVDIIFFRSWCLQLSVLCMGDQALHIEFIVHNCWCCVDNFCLDVFPSCISITITVSLYHFPKEPLIKVIASFRSVVKNQHCQVIETLHSFPRPTLLGALVLPVYRGLMTSGAGSLAGGPFLLTIHS